MIERIIESEIESFFGKQKVIVIYGPRQVGKTTLSKKLLEKHGDSEDYFNCDLTEVRTIFGSEDIHRMMRYIGKSTCIVLDEAQRVQNIGLNLKILHDYAPHIQIIATGSSSFELANKINEPLTGRHIEFHMGPISIKELLSIKKERIIVSELSERLRYGSYPEIITSSSEKEAEIFLRNISSNYLFRDILEHETLKKPELLTSLCQALALQVGNQVSENELAGLLGYSRETIQRYIHLLEQSFVIYKLPSYARNIRNELKFSKKIYFYDIGIRNALINNFNPLSLRQDIGALWENFLISERRKYLLSTLDYTSMYFWRNHLQAEIDYIEEKNGVLSCYEFKWGKKQVKIPQSFQKYYPHASYQIIDQDNFIDFCRGAI